MDGTDDVQPSSPDPQLRQQLSIQSGRGADSALALGVRTSQLHLTIREYGDFSPAPIASYGIAHLLALVQSTDEGSSLVSAQQLNTYFQDRVSIDFPYPEKVYDFLYTFWVEFWNIVEQVPHHHLGQKNLVELVRCLRDMPLAPSEIQKVDVWGMEKRLWRDLPFFEEIALEEVNTIDTEVPETDINFDFERCRWRNFHAFIARLTGSNVVDFSKYALWEFRDVVETQNVIVGLLDFRIPVVASWLEHAGQQLFSKVGAEKWDAWRDRSEDIGNDEQLQISEETRKGVEDLVGLTQRLKRGCDSTEPPS